MSLWKKTLGIRLWSFFKVPMLSLVCPSVKKLDGKTCEILIRLRWLTKNHFNSMYMGVLAAGADAASGLLALEIAKKKGKQGGKVNVIFKAISAEFFRRADSHTSFVCEEGDKIEEAVSRVLHTGERQNIPVTVKAYCFKKSREPVAKFRVTLSLK